MFLVGYTSKMPGSEVGVDSIIPTFSACYAAPYLLREPTQYANMFLSLIEHSHPTLWLLNTGWLTCPATAESRVPLGLTMDLVTAVLTGAVSSEDCVEKGVFGYRVPRLLPGVTAELVEPRRAWTDSYSYSETARRLRESIIGRFVEQGGTRASSKIRRGAPEPVG
jgi:phosphoenolpyruvate carboxykinase (ATP)